MIRTCGTFFIDDQSPIQMPDIIPGTEYEVVVLVVASYQVRGYLDYYNTLYTICSMICMYVCITAVVHTHIRSTGVPFSGTIYWYSTLIEKEQNNRSHLCRGHDPENDPKPKQAHGLTPDAGRMTQPAPSPSWPERSART